MGINNHEQKHRYYDKAIVQYGATAQRPAGTDGLVYRDTDRGGAEFVFNASVGASGTWLSTQEYSVPFQGRTTQQTLSATGGTADRALFPEDRYSISLTRCVLQGAVITTHNATNYWRLDLYRINANGSGSTLILADVARSWDTGRTLGNFYPFKEQVGLSGVSVLGPGILPSFAYIITKVGTPGNLTLEIGGQLYYRLAG